MFYAIGGTASNGEDYYQLHGSVAIPPGRKTARIIVTPIEDPRTEPAPRTVTLRLKPTGSYALGAHTKATALIVDDYHPTIIDRAANSPARFDRLSQP